VRATQPELAATAEALLGRLEALAPEDEQLVPCHGCYRHKQMLGDEHALALVDWDGISMASPALDAATFLGRLLKEPRSGGRPAPELEQIGATFRRTFLEDRPECASQLDLYEGLVLTEQVLRCFRRSREDEQTAREVRHLAAAAAQMLARVERRLIDREA
jgi:thiamine kinase-like enzyme